MFEKSDQTMLYALKTTITAAVLSTLPLTAFATQHLNHSDGIDKITTGSIATHALLWTVDPTLIVGLFGLFCLLLVVTGIKLFRKSMKDGL